MVDTDNSLLNDGELSVCYTKTMNFFKKLWVWDKMQWQKPETRLAVGMAVGVLIGVGADNVGLGFALGITLGVAGYTTYKNK